VEIVVVLELDRVYVTFHGHVSHLLGDPVGIFILADPETDHDGVGLHGREKSQTVAYVRTGASAIDVFAFFRSCPSKSSMDVAAVAAVGGRFGYTNSPASRVSIIR